MEPFDNIISIQPYDDLLTLAAFTVLNVWFQSTGNWVMSFEISFHPAPFLRTGFARIVSVQVDSKKERIEYI